MTGTRGYGQNHINGKFHHMWKRIIHSWLDCFQQLRQNVCFFFSCLFGRLCCSRILICGFIKQHEKMCEMEYLQ